MRKLFIMAALAIALIQCCPVYAIQYVHTPRPNATAHEVEIVNNFNMQQEQMEMQRKQLQLQQRQVEAQENMLRFQRRGY